MRHPGQTQPLHVGAVDPAWTRMRSAQDCDCVPQLTATLPPMVPLLLAQAAPEPRSRPAIPRRRRIWELGSTMHCSIIGTCLTTDELRRLLRKLGFEAPDATDHALHSTAVGLAGQQDIASKLLNKALDERHRITIRRFDAATNLTALRALWRAAVDAGDIPGGYWAVLTHPVADRALATEAFGDVHMLSHLVGAANRADIRRLAEQDRELAKLRETVARQQARLQADLTERDARIRVLQEMVTDQAAHGTTAGAELAEGGAELLTLIAELQRRLDRELRRREASDRRLAAAEAAAAEYRKARQQAEAELTQISQELRQAEAVLTAEEGSGLVVSQEAAPAFGTVLYVGGRSGQTALLRDAAARFGAKLVHHDAEQGSALLPGLVNRADLVVFPVDCVSHDAALSVKRLCRQAGRRFLPLRSSGVTSLAAALASPQAVLS